MVATVMNEVFKPKKEIKESDFEESKHGKDRLDDFKRVMYEHGIGDPLGYLKRLLGSRGTEMIRNKGMSVDPELKEIFEAVKEVAEKQ